MTTTYISHYITNHLNPSLMNRSMQAYSLTYMRTYTSERHKLLQKQKQHTTQGEEAPHQSNSSFQDNFLASQAGQSNHQMNHTPLFIPYSFKSQSSRTITKSSYVRLALLHLTPTRTLGWVVSSTNASCDWRSPDMPTWPSSDLSTEPVFTPTL